MGFVYFISDPERQSIKVGKSWAPWRRFVSIQNGNSATLRLSLATFVGPAAVTVEHDIHLSLKKFRLRGEWFRDCEEVREFMLKFETARCDHCDCGVDLIHAGQMNCLCEKCARKK